MRWSQVRLIWVRTFIGLPPVIRCSKVDRMTCGLWRSRESFGGLLLNRPEPRPELWSRRSFSHAVSSVADKADQIAPLGRDHPLSVVHVNRVVVRPDDDDAQARYRWKILE